MQVLPLARAWVLAAFRNWLPEGNSTDRLPDEMDSHSYLLDWYWTLWDLILLGFEFGWTVILGYHYGLDKILFFRIANAVPTTHLNLCPITL